MRLSESPQVSAQLQSVLESISEGFVALDRDWHYTYVNGRAEVLLGQQASALLGRTPWEMFPQTVGSAFERACHQVMDARTATSVTSFSDVHHRWYEVHVHPDAEDGILIFFRDVSERTRNVEALEESAALLHGISNSTGDVIYAKDLDGRFRYANPAALTLIGRDLDHVRGKTDLDVLEDKEAARLVMQNDRRVMDSRVPLDVEEDVPLPDGTHRVWLSRKMPHRNIAGEVVGLLGVSRDVTEQTRAALRMKQLYSVAASLAEATTTDAVARAALEQCMAALDASAGSLALLAEDGHTVEMAGMFGYTDEAAARWGRFSREDDIPLAEAIRTGKTIFLASAEERLRRYPALASAVAARPTASSVCVPLTISGRAVGCLGLSFDTVQPPTAAILDSDFVLSLGRQCAQALERARLFEAEQRARTEAEHASRMKDEFLTTLSHELRTPLNAIVGWVAILQTTAPREADLRKGLATIERNARAQTQIIEDLLDMSAIVNGKVRLQVQTMDLAAVLHAAIDTVRPAATAKGVTLGIIVDPHAGPIAGDPNRLQQVFWNLLSNAVKFTPRGGRVDVLLARVASHAQITVTDTGAGIPVAFVPYAFDRFRQADASSTRRHGGLGLGLAIVKQLVELHGGSVRAHSRGVDQGSTFVVELPVMSLHPPAEEAAAPHERKEAWLDAQRSDDLRLTGLDILVVDDEPDARSLVQRLLEDRQAVVRTASSAEEAMTLFVERPPSVLVSDIGMPAEDGYSLLRRIRGLSSEAGGQVPAIALTAYARSEDRVRAMRAGFQGHVTKPVEWIELVTAIASVTGRTS